MLTHPQPRSLTEELAEFLAARPSDEEILAYHASEAIQERVSGLLERNRSVGLSPEETREMDEYEFIEHLVAMLKAKTRLRMQRLSA
jgi:hypothetical protein